jgi:hypothetical protein
VEKWSEEGVQKGAGRYKDRGRVEIRESELANNHTPLWLPIPVSEEENGNDHRQRLSRTAAAAVDTHKKNVNRKSS